MVNNYLIEAQGIHKHFKNVNAVNGVDFSILKGEYVALLGPNGAGKTTLVEMIEGIRNPDRGEILVKGRSTREDKQSLYSILGISFQETRFLEKTTVEETIRLFSSFYHQPDEKVEKVILLTGLGEKRKSYTKNLSGGQRQRLALAISLLNDPEILILDEPTTGLDPTARREIWDILLSLKKNHNTSLILTTHYMEEATQLCDRIVIMDKGKFLAEGTFDQLLKAMDLHDTAVFSVEGTIPDSLLSESNGLTINLDTKTGKGRCVMKNVADDMPLLFSLIEKNDLRLTDFEHKRPTLDDLFLMMTGRRLTEDTE